MSNRLVRFYRRFKNQHRIHFNFSIWEIIKIAWTQSK